MCVVYLHIYFVLYFTFILLLYFYLSSLFLIFCVFFLLLCVAATVTTNFPLGINKVYIYLSICLKGGLFVVFQGSNVTQVWL